jgi:hypothetical protein
VALPLRLLRSTRRWTSSGMQQLFEEMDSSKRGHVDVAQAVQLVEEHPEAMANTRKTALLHHSAPVLVQERAKQE